MTSSRGRTGAQPTDPDSTSVPVPRSQESSAGEWLRAASDFAWRGLVVAGLIVVVGLALERLRVVVLPLFFALMLTSLLLPARRALERRGLPRPLAAATVLTLTAIAIVAAAAWLGTALVGEAPALRTAISSGVDEVARWGVQGPLHLPQSQVDEFVTQLRNEWTSNEQRVLHGALANAPLALEVSIGVVLTLVLTAFLVIDGDGIAERALASMSPWFPEPAQRLARQSWVAVGAYSRGVLVNASINATVIGVGLWLLGVPLALPIAAITFVASYVPILGALVAGSIAVVVALAANGVGAALLVVLLTILVHAIEAYLIGPFVVGRAVHLHPLVVLLAVSVGSAVAGVTGAIVAVPVAATIAVALGELTPGPATS